LNIKADAFALNSARQVQVLKIQYAFPKFLPLMKNLCEIKAKLSGSGKLKWKEHNDLQDSHVTA
jgi:hypothetical protein